MAIGDALGDGMSGFIAKLLKTYRNLLIVLAFLALSCCLWSWTSASGQDVAAASLPRRPESQKKQAPKQLNGCGLAPVVGLGQALQVMKEKAACKRCLGYQEVIVPGAVGRAMEESLCFRTSPHRPAPRPYNFFTFNLEDDEHVSFGMLASGGIYDGEVHSALAHALSVGAAQESLEAPCAGRWVLDVGSNIGTLTLYASALGCRVHAFELQPRVTNVLYRSILSNGFVNTSIHNTPVSDKAGVAVEFREVKGNPGGVGLRKGGQSGLHTVTLDEQFPGEGTRIFFLKVDTEGHEMPVLRSAKRLLGEQRIENIVLELRSSQAKEATHMLYGNGYTCRIARRLGCEDPFLPACYSQIYADGVSSEEEFKERLEREKDFLNVHCIVPPGSK